MCVYFLYTLSAQAYFIFFILKPWVLITLSLPALGTSDHSSRLEFEGHGLQHPPLASFTCMIDLCVCKLMKLCTDGASCGSRKPMDLDIQ